MGKPSRYYLGRVTKWGEMTQALLVQAISDPPRIISRQSRFTFVSVRKIQTESGVEALYGELAKYKPDAEVRVVNEEAHSADSESVPYMLRASANFVYVPSLSGIAYRHVAGEIHFKSFSNLFERLIGESVYSVLAGVQIHPISDLRSFVTKLGGMDVINAISAKVEPPNPLFGSLWKSLFDYVKKRNLDQLAISETSSGGLVTRLPLVAGVIDPEGVIPRAAIEEFTAGDESISDAAVLMAADGYGVASVRGFSHGRKVEFSSSEDQKNFLLDNDGSPERLADETVRRLSKINDERDLQH